MTRSPRSVECSARIYDALVRAYPTSFHQEYGTEMTRVFRELASDAWARGGWVGLARVWLGVSLDLARTLPHQHWLACLGAMRMKTFSSPLKATTCACISIATAFALNLVLFAVLNGMIWLVFASGGLGSYQHWPPTEMFVTLLPPFFTGAIVSRAKPFYRPYLTAPLALMMFAAALSFSDPRTPRLIAMGYPLLVGAAAIVGCYLSGCLIGFRKTWGIAVGRAGRSGS